MASLTNSCDIDVTAELDRIKGRLQDGYRVQVGTTNADAVAGCYLNKVGITYLRYHKQAWWLFTETHYEAVTETDLEAKLWAYTSTLYDDQTSSMRERFQDYKDQLVPRSVTNHFVRDVLGALKSKTLVSADIEIPSCLSGDREAKLIAFSNGLVNVRRLVDGNPSVEPHGPWWFSPNVLPFKFDPQGKCPQWETFVNEVLEGDAERIALLRQWMGYCLVPDASFHKFLLLVGRGRNGKGVTANVLTGLLGRDNVSGVPLETFADRFALSATVGKLLNVCSEATAISRRVENEVKKYTGGDLVDTDRKHINRLTFRPTARLLIQSNDRPKFADKSDGLWSRLMVLPFDVQIPEERQVKNLDQKLLQAEASGIFNWAIEGLRTLYAQGQFTVPSVSRETIDIYRAEDDPLTGYLKDTFEPFDGKMTSSSEAYRDYTIWAESSGEQTISKSEFGKEVKRVFGVESEQLSVRGSRDTYYLDLKRLGHLSLAATV